MAFTNPLLEKWKSGECAFGFWMTIPSAYAVEIVAGTGPDWVGIDMQHGLVDYNALVQMSLAAWHHGSVPIVRTTANDHAEIGRALDAGALGVVVPMVESVEEAVAAVRACRYPPHGRRSFGPARTFHGSWDPRVVEQVACIVMIETPDGVANVEEIVTTPGVDGVLLGPGDLAIGLGLDPDDRPPVHAAAIARIVKACVDAKVAVGQVVGNGTRAAELARGGFLFVGYSGDSAMLDSGSRRELAIARGEG